MTEQLGMTPRETWRDSEVHKVSTYSCGKCGMTFEFPDEFYEHLDTVHPPKAEQKKAA